MPSRQIIKISHLREDRLNAHFINFLKFIFSFGQYTNMSQKAARTLITQEKSFEIAEKLHMHERLREVDCTELKKPLTRWRWESVKERRRGSLKGDREVDGVFNDGIDCNCRFMCRYGLLRRSVWYLIFIKCAIQRISLHYEEMV